MARMNRRCCDRIRHCRPCRNGAKDRLRGFRCIHVPDQHVHDPAHRAAEVEVRVLLPPGSPTAASVPDCPWPHRSPELAGPTHCRHQQETHHHHVPARKQAAHRFPDAH